MKIKQFIVTKWKNTAIIALLLCALIMPSIPVTGDVIHIQEGGTVAEATNVHVGELGAATYDDVQDYINFFGDRTLLSGGAITAHGDADGSVAIAACTAWCKISNSDMAVGKFFDYAGKAKQTLTDLIANLIYLDYNAGTPQIVVATTSATYGFQQDHILIGVVFRQGNAVHIKQSSNIGIQGISRAFMHAVEHFGPHRASGLVTSDGGALSLSITTGIIYAGLIRQTTAVDGSTWSYWYTSDSGATWTEDTGQSVLVQSYNDITSGKVALGSNKYGVHWVYVDYEGAHVHIVYGHGNYNVNQAEEAGVPSVLPPIVTGFGVLIAKIINQEGTNDMTITYPWTTVFTSSLATDHGSLGGLGDNDHPQYMLVASPELGGDLDGEGYKIHDIVSPYAKKTAAYTTTIDDEIIGVDTSFVPVTITLGSAACRDGQTITIADWGGNSMVNAITIATEGAELIDGVATDTINSDRFSKQYYSDGSNWFSYSLTDDHIVYGLLQLGTFANLPDVGTNGRLYYASDTKQLWRDNGAAWGNILHIEDASTTNQGIVMLENPPTEDEAGKAPTSEWAYDHAADGSAHQSNVITITYIIDGGGSVITTGEKGHLEIPFACTITGWTLLADQSGSIVIDVWKDTYANFPPAVADTIAGSEKPTLSAVQKNQDLALGTWTTAVSAGDILAFNVDSASTVERITLSIRATKT